MSFDQQTAFSDVELVLNPEPRVPCVLVVDRSGSMQENNKIGQLNEGLRVYKDELVKDELAKKRVETAIVEFGPVNVRSHFTIAESLMMPRFSANGDTPMGQAIMTALDLVRRRKADYKAAGTVYYRPWVFLITDGEPTDGNAWMQAAQLIRNGVAAREFVFHAVGVDGADMSVLNQLAPQGAKALSSTRFVELFQWLSGTMKMVSGSSPGQALQLAPTSSWEMITT